MLRVLNEIASSDDAASPSLSELARRTDLPKSTLHRLLGVMESHGVIERDTAGYQLSDQTRRLAGRALRDEALRRAVMPYLMDLYLRVNQAISLAVLRGGRVVYLETLFEGRHQRFVHLTGMTGPAHATASGKLLLAYQPTLLARLGARNPLLPFTEHTITDPAALMAEFARIRREGVAFNADEHLLGGVGVAAPLVGPRRMPIAAIAVGGFRGRIDLAAVAAQLRPVAAAASTAVALRLPPHQNRRGVSDGYAGRRT